MEAETIWTLRSSLLIFVVTLLGVVSIFSDGLPHRILLDTDVDTDDLFALIYLLKFNRSEIELQAITINTNAWTDAGHAVNQVYDILYMMNRDDIVVGMGGEGGIDEDGTIQPNVGGYLPLIEQGIGTAGYCRYRQTIHAGRGGRLDVNSNYGLRKSFLPQGSRRYSPLRQPTSQQVMIDTISSGPITVITIGTHTNLAIFLMTNPHLKKNIQHIYVMGGGVRSKNPTDCFRKENTTASSFQPQECGDRGNLFTDYTSNPYAEFNIFGDPFAAYQVIHSGIPVTLVPLDATNTIPITKEFFDGFEKMQYFTYEAQYCFKSMKITRDTWIDDQFNTTYFMWDSFTAGVASKIMRNTSYNPTGVNTFAEMEFMNITVITSNKPYGISDGSNPLFDGRKSPKFNLTENGVHSGHVQTGLRDPFCIVKNGKGRCQDGYTKEISGPESVSVRVATRAKPNLDPIDPLNREYFWVILDVLNKTENTGRFNFTNQFPYYKETLYTPDFKGRKLGKNVVFDMDMSAGDFLALFYLLKQPVEVINLKAILVSATGWANAATIDVIYDLLHMMGRDDIPVGLGDVLPMNQSDSVFSAVGDCKYTQAIPNGNGGFLDSDTLYGLARDLPRSPRRFTSENSVKYGAPRDTDHPELRQPLAMEVWDSVSKNLDSGSKVTILTNGPLTNLAKIIINDKNANTLIQEVFINGGHIRSGDNKNTENGNIFTIPANKFAEFNMFLDPMAAKTVFESGLNITLIPLSVQRKLSEFPVILERLRINKKTPEAFLAKRLLSLLYKLQQKKHRYQHVGMFLGEILGAVVMAGDRSQLNSEFIEKSVVVVAMGLESEDGQTIITDANMGKMVRILENVDSVACYDDFVARLADRQQSAVVGSFEEQKQTWSKPPK
ncbi:uncharacterized protein LOC124924437 [Impatiens glandulifera]|uniref:uncharacterized protein LOC124924437 n=1 Tax=Impatiens glandulifera TaxID=253017 RepID=UPI001FB09274|nr:uncharacterized protein LOC124924437 [Impatiens glandulifera]